MTEQCINVNEALEKERLFYVHHLLLCALNALPYPRATSLLFSPSLWFISFKPKTKLDKSTFTPSTLGIFLIWVERWNTSIYNVILPSASKSAAEFGASPPLGFSAQTRDTPDPEASSWDLTLYCWPLGAMVSVFPCVTMAINYIHKQTVMSKRTNMKRTG